MTRKTTRKADKEPPVEPTLGLIAGPDISRAIGCTAANVLYWEKSGRFIPKRVGGRVFYTREQYEQMKAFREANMKKGLGRKRIQR